MFRQNVFSNNGTLVSALALLALIAGAGFSGVAGAAPPPSGPAVAAGCVVGGNYASVDSGGFAAADYTFTHTTVTAGGEVALSFSTPTVQEAYTVPFDQDVYAAFVYEDPLDLAYYNSSQVIVGNQFNNSMGWFIKPLVEQELAAVGFPSSNKLHFYFLYWTDQNFYNVATNKYHLINYLFPRVTDTNNDNIFDRWYDPVWYTLGLDGFGNLYTAFTSVVWGPSTESDYSAKSLIPNGDGILDGRDARIKVGRFKAGTQISFFQNRDFYHVRTAYTTKDAGTNTYWSYQNDFSPQPAALPSYPACANVGKAVNSAKTKRELLVSNAIQLGGGVSYVSLNLKFDLAWPAPQSVPEDFVAGVPVLLGGADCKYVSMDYKGAGGTSYPYSWTQGLFPTAASNALSNIFGLSFTGTVNAGDYEIYFLNGVTTKNDFNRALWLAPDKDPFSTLLTFESHYTGYDLDFNDNMFLIEARNGGTVQMNVSASPSATLAAAGNAFITTATIKVQDTMPSASCGVSPGDTRIDYYLSTNGGEEWTRVHEWDLARSGDITGDKVYDWTPGITMTSYQAVTKPVSETTYREATVSFISNAVVGNVLLWKADMITVDKTCSPRIASVALSYNASGPRGFAHTAPVPLSNVIYDASFKWDSAWLDNTDFRGHVFSKELYDPWFSENSAGFTPVLNWDAGDKLGGSASSVSTKKPEARRILLPDTSVYSVVNETVALSSGSVINGVARTVSGRLANRNVVSGTIEISGWDSYGRLETFRDYGVRSLDGEMVGTGDINRGTGDFTVTFTRAPGVGTHLVASYNYYTVNTTTPALLNTGLVNYLLVGLDGRSIMTNAGRVYEYDLNGDKLFDGLDKDWLLNWARGYSRKRSGFNKEWFLGAIDHSTPAVVGAPGLQGWYYGSDIKDDDRISFDQYRCEQRKRPTQLYVGSRSGMLHSFYAGEFRPYYVDESKLAAPFTCDFSNEANLFTFRGDFNKPKDTGAINPKGAFYRPPGTPPAGVVDPLRGFPINRGYYEWPTGAGPNYGDGSETFSLIPANLLSRLKNLPMNREDKAFMDASPVASHVRFADGTWHNMVITAQGNGGDHIVGLDVTDTANPKIMWDYADPDLYRSRSAPSIGSVGRVVAGGNSQWVVMFVSGVNTDPHGYPKIYMLEIETGKLLYELNLDTDIEAQGATPSGQPALLDSDGNGYADRWFIGTDKGVVFKGVMPDNPLAATGTDFEICTFFKTHNKVAPSDPNERLAIYASPSVTSTNTLSSTGKLEYKINVFFGTSSSPYHDDDPGDTYKFYAVRDTDDKTKCTAGNELWNMDLPAGQQVYAAAFATAGRVYFGTSTATSEDPCAPTAAAAGGTTGNIFVCDIENGSALATLATGNTAGSLVVDDNHLYFRTSDGRVMSRGGDTFQNATKQGGFSEAVIVSWMEVLR